MKSHERNKYLFVPSRKCMENFYTYVCLQFCLKIYNPPFLTIYRLLFTLPSNYLVLSIWFSYVPRLVSVFWLPCRPRNASRGLLPSAEGQAHRLPRSLRVSSFGTERAKSWTSLQFLTNPIDFPAKGSWGELRPPRKSMATFLAVAGPRVLCFSSVWCMWSCSIMEAVDL